MWVKVVWVKPFLRFVSVNISVFITAAIFRLQQYRPAILSRLTSQVYCNYMGISTSLECN